MRDDLLVDPLDRGCLLVEETLRVRGGLRRVHLLLEIGAAAEAEGPERDGSCARRIAFRGGLAGAGSEPRGDHLEGLGELLERDARFDLEALDAFFGETLRPLPVLQLANGRTVVDHLAEQEAELRLWVGV